MSSATSATVKKRALEKLASVDISLFLCSSERQPHLVPWRCADAEPSNNHVIATLVAHGANVKAFRRIPRALSAGIPKPSLAGKPYQCSAPAGPAPASGA